MSNIQLGDRVLVFDYKLWEEVGHDIGDNSQFRKLATVKYVYLRWSNCGKCFDKVVDVIFDHRGLSKAHFISGIKKVNYYILIFGYFGPKSNFGCGGSDEALSNAEKLAEECISKVGYEYRHCYCWPDGSLYKYIRTIHTKNEVFNNIKIPDSLYLRMIKEVNPNDKAIMGDNIEKLFCS